MRGLTRLLSAARTALSFVSALSYFVVIHAAAWCAAVYVSSALRGDR